MCNDLSECKTFIDLSNHLIFSDVTLQIPDYQRPYAWDEENVRVFLKDLSDSKGKYFLGLFLFNLTKEGGINIIDGQQRLTTIFILLNCIRKKYGSVWKISNGNSVDLSKLLCKQGYCRLSLQKTINNNYFQDLFKQSKLSSLISVEKKGYFSERCLMSTFEICFSYVNDLTREQTIEVVEKLFLSQTIVHEELDSGMAMRIFELMNDRGKSLTNLEAVKSYAISLIYDLNKKMGYDQNSLTREFIYNDFIEINQLIEKINKYDDSFRGDEILLYHVIAFCDWENGEFWNTKEQFKKHLLAQASDIDAIRSIIDNLAKSYRFVHELFSDIFESQVRKYKWFKNLYLLGQMANFYPLLLAIQGRFEPTERDCVLNVVCNYLELFSFRVYSIGRLRSDAAQSRFYSLAKAIKKLTKEQIYNKLENIIRDYCVKNTKQFEDHLTNTNFYNSTRSPAKIYLYVKYENYLVEKDNSSEGSKYSDIFRIKSLSIDDLSDQERKEANKRQATIEHIVPQEFNKKEQGGQVEYYSRLLKNSEGQFLDEVDSEKAGLDPIWYFNDNYLHSIGNLVLSNRGPNSSKGNNYPERKDWNSLASQREILKAMNSARTITQLYDRIGVFDMKFNVTLINDRAAKIKNFADTYWSVDAFIEATEENQGEIKKAKDEFFNRSALI